MTGAAEVKVRLRNARAGDDDVVAGLNGLTLARCGSASGSLRPGRSADAAAGLVAVFWSGTVDCVSWAVPG